ncbi:MAG: hypothetical protein AAGG48_05095 [Planctomycetota bacterium]
MQDFFGVPAVRTGLALLVLCVLIAAGFYLVSIFRDYADEDQQDPDELLANLREMHRKGDISDQEFRNIQAKTHRTPAGTESIDDSTSQADSSAGRQS